MNRRFLSAALTAVLAWASTGAIATAADEWPYRRAELAPFDQSIIYVVTGEQTKAGCTYEYPDFKVPADVDWWQVRDIALDPERCRKLVEEGVPTVDTAPASASDMASTSAVISSAGGAEGSGFATTSVASGYARAWYTDLPGYEVTSDTTYISWTYNGTCTQSGNASANWSWRAGTGWSLISGSNGGTANRTCSRYFADSWATMKNSAFCPWTTVYTYYYHVRIYGWYNGTVTGSRSDATSGGLCLPLFENFDYRRTG